ncbi:MAG: cupin domain-containing protein [Acidobacteriota bacterium]
MESDSLGLESPAPTPSVLVAREGVRIPVPGGKLIEELMGRASTASEGFSLAHMVAPGGWTEPPQTPSFGELTIVIRGQLAVEVAGQQHAIGAGQAIYTAAGERVVYSNPFDEEAEYYAICWPAFSPDGAGREEDAPVESSPVESSQVEQAP